MTEDSSAAIHYAAQRHHMVATQLIQRGITDQMVLQAMRTVPREVFVAPELAPHAYEDAPLPIAAGQTISQPYIVALMAEALHIHPTDRLLEIGTGSGYGAAVLSFLARVIYTIERLAPLVQQARQRLQALGYTNVQVYLSNGTMGWPEHAPYNGIVVTAGGPVVPPALLEQLAAGGRLVMPVGPQQTQQRLVRVTRESDGSLRREDLGAVRFVPLLGAQGWPAAACGVDPILPMADPGAQ